MTSAQGAVGASQGYPELDDRIEAYIRAGVDRPASIAAPTSTAADAHATVADAEFDRLALELFAFQYEHNEPYRRFCRARRAEPGRVKRWTQIPPVPLTAFKELTLACEPPEQAAAVFLTSGSTDARLRGRNQHPHLRLYDASLRVNFAHYFLPDRDRMRLLVLNPCAKQDPHSSLAYFFTRLVDFFGTPTSEFLVSERGVDWQRLAAILGEAEVTGEPLALLGTSFAYVHLLDTLAQEGLSYSLPVGSRLLDTGGYKGRSREVAADDLRALIQQRLGIGDSWCVNYYGMTEISTQYYDHTLRSAWRGSTVEPRHKSAPPWTRIRVLDPETGQPVEPGKRGLVVHYDLANRGSCLAVMAEDMGYLVPAGQTTDAPEDGFVLLGRAEGTQARGCSIALDELLEANRGRPW